MSRLEAIGLVAATFGLTMLLTRPLIGWLSAGQFGKAIRVDGPAHAAKAGTPTMGGLGMLAAIALAAAYLGLRLPGPSEDGAAGLGPQAMNPWTVWLVLAAMLGFGILGLMDDLAGLARKGRRRAIGVGLTARQMLVGQTLVATIVCLVTVALAGATALGLDGLPGRLAFTALGILAIVGTANGANLSDGLDGLAAGLAVLAFGSLGIAIALRQVGPAALRQPLWPPASVLALAIAGACLGFLVYNRHPAQVFMGNVASLSLGAGLATLSLVGGVWVLLPIIGGVFLVEVLSDLVQIAVYKRTGGRRVLRMAPIHHHFELGGWPETQIVLRFWLAGLAAGLSGIVITYLWVS